MKTVLIFIMALQVAACSSDYVPDEKMLAYKKDMNVEQAKEIIQKQLWPNQEIQGICGSRGFWYDNNSEMLVGEDKINLLAHKRGKQLKKKSQNFDDIVIFEKSYYEYEFGFNDVNAIYIYRDPGLLPYFPGCNKKDITEKYVIIDLFNDELNNLKFIVPGNEFDRTMAALSILFPGREVKIK